MFNQLTQKDIDDMMAEIEERKVVIRPKLLEAVKEARAHGDLSENFEYYAAKKEKNANESRIRFLERMIKTAEVIDDSSASDEVGINDTVRVLYVEDKEEDEYTIVSTMRGDALNNLITIESPIGKAIMGHKVGDEVTVNVSAECSYTIKILKIDKDDAGKNARLRSF
ncbi:MAG: transcription elongation factor GreA [Lachnospiraceae bacterium]|nr:transcription elongation factor GreA [Lachnospiraceae bacterium]